MSRDMFDPDFPGMRQELKTMGVSDDALLNAVKTSQTSPEYEEIMYRGEMCANGRVPKDGKTRADAAKAEAYGLAYLTQFRSDVVALEAALEAARGRLAIAELEFSEGRMVTGNATGIPSLLAKVLNLRSRKI
jgi:hypothetical protein